MADNTTINTGSGGDVIATDDISGVKWQRIKVGFGADGSASDVSSSNPLPGKVTDGTNSASIFPATFIRTTDEPRQVFYDPFDAALDSTNLWTATSGNAGTAASVTTGVLSMATGTSAFGWSKLVSIPSFKPFVPAWIGYSFAIALPDGGALISNSTRFFGAGTVPGVPTAAAPITDGVGFELTTSGTLLAVSYAGGTRTTVATLTTPTDTAYHRYIVYIRTDRAYWYIDGLAAANLVATSNFQGPQVQTLPVAMVAASGATPPASTVQIQCTGLAVWDTGKNTTQIGDGSFPFRKATVKAASTAPVAADNALVVGLHSTSITTTASALTNVSGSVASGTLLASNVARRGALFFNDSTASLYIGLTASSVSSTSFSVKIPAGGFFELPGPCVWTGQVNGIWDAATGSVRITELS